MSDAPANRQTGAPHARWRELRAAVADRLRARRWMLLAAAATFAALMAAGALAPLPALAGLTAIAAAALGLPRADASPDTTAAERARWARERLRDVLEALPDPALVLAPGGIVLLANAKARDQFGRLKPGDDISSHIRNPDFLDALAATERGAPPGTVVYAERVPVGRRIAATLAHLHIDPRTAETPAVLVCLRDLTEQERLNQMRADFIANASHELRTPLASLSGFIETLQGPARDDREATDRFLAIMGEQATRMSRLIADLLSLSRVEMNVHLVPTERVDVAEVARHVRDALDPLARESGIALTLEGADAPAWVRGDGDELVQLFQNLAQNAIKYGREGGHVWVRLDRLPGAAGPGSRIAVAVRDDGPGIPADDLPRLTERFYRVDVATSRAKGGTGLGLAIAKHIANRHRARLDIASELGKGSTFTVVLDAAGDDPR